MNRDDTSRFFLYIEPKKEEKLSEAINDAVTELLEMALSKAKEGAADYSGLRSEYPKTKEYLQRHPENTTLFSEGGGGMGVHTTDCGEWSGNHDYMLENGLVTNSLCTFYARWYRNSIKENDWNKIKELAKFYNIKII